jgi:hypothetical protein
MTAGATPWSCSPRSHSPRRGEATALSRCDLDPDTHSQGAARVRGEIFNGADIPEVKPTAQSLSRVPAHPHGPAGVKMTDHVQVTPGAGVEVHVVVKPAWPVL